MVMKTVICSWCLIGRILSNIWKSPACEPAEGALSPPADPVGSKGDKTSQHLKGLDRADCELLEERGKEAT